MNHGDAGTRNSFCSFCYGSWEIRDRGQRQVESCDEARVLPDTPNKIVVPLFLQYWETVDVPFFSFLFLTGKAHILTLLNWLKRFVPVRSVEEKAGPPIHPDCHYSRWSWGLECGWWGNKGRQVTEWHVSERSQFWKAHVVLFDPLTSTSIGVRGWNAGIEVLRRKGPNG